MHCYACGMTYNLPMVNHWMCSYLQPRNLACLLRNQNHLYSIYRLPVHILDMLGGWFSLNHLQQTRDNWLDKPNLCSASRQYRFICALISPELVSYFVTKLSSSKYFNLWISFSGALIFPELVSYFVTKLSSPKYGSLSAVRALNFEEGCDSSGDKKYMLYIPLGEEEEFSVSCGRGDGWEGWEGWEGGRVGGVMGGSDGWESGKGDSNHCVGAYLYGT